MLKRTVPAVSFTTSHRALCLRSTKPIFGKDMTSPERWKAAWDDMPFTNWHMPKKAFWEWDLRTRYEFGLRCNHRQTKANWAFFYFQAMMASLILWHAYRPLHIMQMTSQPPPGFRKDDWYESCKGWGREVWCADGKFVTPWCHVNPPMLTFTQAELNAQKDALGV